MDAFQGLGLVHSGETAGKKIYNENDVARFEDDGGTALDCFLV